MKKDLPFILLVLFVFLFLLGGVFIQGTAIEASKNAGVAAIGGAALPFGGSISLIKYCNGGIIYARVNGKLGGNFIWLPGAYYLNGRPKNVGQNTLGLASPAQVPCTIGTTVFGFGKPVIFGTMGKGISGTSRN